MVYLISSLMCIGAIGGLSSQQTVSFLQNVGVFFSKTAQQRFEFFILWHLSRTLLIIRGLLHIVSCSLGLCGHLPASEANSCSPRPCQHLACKQALWTSQFDQNRWRPRPWLQTQTLKRRRKAEAQFGNAMGLSGVVGALAGTLGLAYAQVRRPVPRRAVIGGDVCVCVRAGMPVCA